MAKKRQYTRDEYSQEERAVMDELYEGHFRVTFADNPAQSYSKELEENQVLSVRITQIRGTSAIGETSVGQSVAIDLMKDAFLKELEKQTKNTVPDWVRSLFSKSIGI